MDFPFFFALSLGTLAVFSESSRLQSIKIECSQSSVNQVRQHLCDPVVANQGGRE